MGRALKILLVEDNRADVFLFQEALRHDGIEFELSHFLSGEEALAHLRRTDRTAHDLIVLDLHLPGIDGNEVLREIRREPTLAAVPVSIVSGAPPGARALLDLRGSSAIVHKSMNVREYFERVGSMVRALCLQPSPGV